MSINKVILVGNVGADPEVRHLDNDVAVANLRLATSESYIAKNGERITTTEWHNIVLWRSLAKLAENYIRKGKQLYIEGRLRTRSYDDKDGQKKYITEIYGDVVRLLGSREDKPQEQISNTQAPVAASNNIKEDGPNYENHPEDDLPF